jgi:hypothetical protein
MIEWPDRQTEAYLKPFNLAVIVIASSRDGCLIDSARDLGAAQAAIRQRGLQDITAAGWAENIDVARQAVEVALHELRQVQGRDGKLAVEAGFAVEVIGRVAKRLEIRLTDHATLMARAKAASAQLGVKLDGARVTGDLQFFNKEFKRRRRAAEASGQRFMTYNQALARLRAAMAGHAASRFGGEVSEATLLGRVFGE